MLGLTQPRAPSEEESEVYPEVLGPAEPGLAWDFMSGHMPETCC